MGIGQRCARVRPTSIADRLPGRPERRRHQQQPHPEPSTGRLHGAAGTAAAISISFRRGKGSEKGELKWAWIGLCDMLGMHRDQEQAIKELGRHWTDGLPSAWQHMVGFVENEPVRSTRVRAPLLQSRQQALARYRIVTQPDQSAPGSRKAHGAVNFRSPASSDSVASTSPPWTQARLAPSGRSKKNKKEISKQKLALMRFALTKTKVFIHTFPI